MLVVSRFSFFASVQGQELHQVVKKINEDLNKISDKYRLLFLHDYVYDITNSKDLSIEKINQIFAQFNGKWQPVLVETCVNGTKKQVRMNPLISLHPLSRCGEVDISNETFEPDNFLSQTFE